MRYRSNPVEFKRELLQDITDQIQKDQFEIQLCQKLGREIEGVCPYLIYQEPFPITISDSATNQLAKLGLQPDFLDMELRIYADAPQITNTIDENVEWRLYLEGSPIGRGGVHYTGRIWQTHAANIAYQGLGIYPAILKFLRRMLGPIRSDDTLSPGSIKAWERAGAKKIINLKSRKTTTDEYYSLRRFRYNPRYRRNTDEELRELERGYLHATPEAWTKLARKREKSGLMWPAPPDSFCRGFSFMEQDEINSILEYARINRDRVEAVYAPGMLEILGKIWDWPSENVKEGLPYWSKVRFYVGRSTGTDPILLKIANRRSFGGSQVSDGEFVYVRLLSEDKRGRWTRRFY